MRRVSDEAAGRAQPDVVSISVPGFPGPNRTLATLAEVTGASRHVVLADTRRGGPQTRFILGYLDSRRPRAIILGGWSRQYEPLVARARPGGPRWTVYWASSPGQMGLSGEIESYLGVIGDRRIAVVLYADARLARGPLSRLKPSGHLPVLAPPVPTGPPRARRGPSVVSLFLSAREAARKNVFTTLLALADLDCDYVLYLNGLSADPGFRTLLQKLAIPYRDFGWMERRRYEQVLARVEVGLQVSFSESFNQVVADHGVRGIPVVVSEMIPVLRGLAPPVRARLVVANPDDPAAIRAALTYLISRPRERARIGAAVREQVARDHATNVRIAARVLRRL
jgi:glycosyltransferase involved in cell wall biosynthesis